MVFLWFSYGLLKVIALIFVTLRRPSSGLPRDPRPAQRPFVRCRSHRPWSRHWGWTSSNDAVANVQQIPGGFFFNWDNQLLRITHVVTCDVCLYEVYIYIYMIYMIYMYIFVFFDWDNQLLKKHAKTSLETRKPSVTGAPGSTFLVAKSLCRIPGAGVAFKRPWKMEISHWKMEI